MYWSLVNLLSNEGPIHVHKLKSDFTQVVLDQPGNCGYGSINKIIKLLCPMLLKYASVHLYGAQSLVRPSQILLAIG